MCVKRGCHAIFEIGKAADMPKTRDTCAVFLQLGKDKNALETMTKRKNNA
jgi:hypothetical protein